MLHRNRVGPIRVCWRSQMIETLEAVIWSTGSGAKAVNESQLFKKERVAKIALGVVPRQPAKFLHHLPVRRQLVQTIVIGLKRAGLARRLSMLVQLAQYEHDK